MYVKLRLETVQLSSLKLIDIVFIFRNVSLLEMGIAATTGRDKHLSLCSNCFIGHTFKFWSSKDKGSKWLIRM